MRLSIHLFLFMFMAATAGTLHAQGAPLTRADVRAIVKEYIENNGELITDSIIAAEERKQAAQIATLINADTPTKGPADAKVTIIEFSDFECPFCLRAQETIRDLDRRYPGKIRWAYKHLPLGFHAMAKPAAYATIAAQQQGKFWEYSEQIWKRQEFLGEKLFTEIARELKLDMDKFNADRNSPKTKAIVERDLAEARQVGASGTPHFLVNGQAITGAQPASAFTPIIEDALK